MKVRNAICLATLAAAAIACGKGSTSDPATIGRDALNPPSGLVTITGDKQIKLRWKTANAEKDFKGYDVFAVKGTLASLGTPSYPKNLSATLATGAQVPRCVDNTALFEKFGFKASTADCSGDAAAPATAAKTKTGTSLADSTTGTSTDAAPEKLTNLVACKENASDTTISIPESGQSLDPVECTVTSIGGEALANGTTYTFFVTAIAGDDKDKTSWTSNFVEDAPATSLFPSTLTFSPAVNSFYVFGDANLVSQTAYTAVPTASACAASSTSGGDDPCRINRLNQHTAGGIYFGRLGSGSYPQRVFISVPANGDIKLQLRGPQVFDNGTFATSVPGDEATSTYVSDGTLFPVYGNQVFDLSVTSGGKTFYGKVVIGTLTPTEATPTGALGIPLTIIMQPQAGSTHYFN